MQANQNLEAVFQKYYEAKNFLSYETLDEFVAKLYELLSEIKKISVLCVMENPLLLQLVRVLVSQTRYYWGCNKDLIGVLNLILNEIGCENYNVASNQVGNFRKPPLNIHIGVMYHKKFELFFNECLYPMHVGKACSDFELGLPGDDIGDNISLKNSAYAELSGLYWVWKNVKADVKGLMHYRRLMKLQGDELYNNIMQINLDKDSNASSIITNLGLTSDNISGLMENNDMLVRYEEDFTIWNNQSISVHYGDHHLIKHMEYALEVIREDYPEMYPSVVSTFAGTKNYFANVFIMKSQIFDKLCEWLFDVLGKVEKRLNPYDINLAPETVNARWAGYLGERLVGAYIRKLIEDGVKCSHYPMIMFNAPVGIGAGLSGMNNSWIHADTYSKESLTGLWDEKIDTNDVLVSVILPKATRKCIRALQSQTLKNIEVITLDKSLQLKDIKDLSIKRVLLNDLKFLVELCQGKFIHFMNGEDYLGKDFYKNTVYNAIKNNSEIVVTTGKNEVFGNEALTTTSVLPATLYGGGLNTSNNIDVLMTTPELYSKLYSKEFLLSNNDFFKSTNPLLFYWKTILNAEKISILRDTQYKHIINPRVSDQPEDTQNILQTLNEVDLMTQKSSKPVKEMVILQKNRILYELICKNIDNIAQSNEIGNLITEYISAYKMFKNSDDTEKKLDFYIYNKTLMSKILGLKDKNQIQKEILDSMMELVLEYNKIDIKYLYNQSMV